MTLNKKDAQKPFELTASMKQYLESDLAPREHPESINDEGARLITFFESDG